MGTTMHAQVEWKDRYVMLASGDQRNPSIARPANDAYTLVVWEDYAGNDADIYASMIDQHGVAVWGSIDGVAVCTQGSDQLFPRAAYDGDGGVIITWEDHRNGLPEVFAHRIILATGQLDANWSQNPDGVPVCEGTGGDALQPRIVGTEDGAFIAWTDTRNNYDVYIQYLESSTGSWPTGGSNLWMQNGLRVCSPDGTRNPDLTLDFMFQQNDPRSGVVIAYENYSSGYSQIYVSDLDACGNVLFETSADPTSENQTNPKIAPTNVSGGSNLGSLVVWEDERSAGATGIDLYAQCIETNGALRWGSGVSICSASEDQINPRLSTSHTSSAVGGVVVWEDKRDYGSSGIDIYANGIDASSGTVAATDGSPICLESGDQHNPGVEAIDADEQAFIAWEDARAGYVYYQLMDVPNWSILRQTDGWPATMAKETRTDLAVGYNIVVFADLRRGDYNIYAQKVGDECDGATEVSWRDMYAKWTPNTVAANQKQVVDASGNVFVIWEEDRIAGTVTGPEIYIQKFDVDGVPQWQNNGVRLSSTNSSSQTPDICPGPSGGVYVVWSQLDPSATDPVITAVLVSSGGGVSSMNYNYGEGVTPKAVDDDAGKAIFVWVDSNGDLVNWKGDVSTQLWKQTQQAPTLGSFSEPKISKNKVGTCWIVVRWSTQLRVYFIRPNGGTYVQESAPIMTCWSGYQGFDLCTDEIQTTLNDNHPDYDYDVIIAAAEDYPMGDMMVYRFRVNYVTEVENLFWRIVKPQGGNNVFPRNPSIVADGRHGTSDVFGGALLSWNEYDFISGDAIEVLAQRILGERSGSFHWNTGNPAVSDPLTICNGNWYSNNPKIGRLFTGSTQSPPYYEIPAIIVWEYAKANGCVTSTNIHIQKIDAAQPASNAILWASDGQPVSMSRGDEYMPIISKSINNSCSIFWLDERTGSRGVVGTRIFCDQYGTLAKRTIAASGTQPNGLFLSQSAPNPTSDRTTIRFRIESTQDVVLNLYDVLGRKVATLFDRRIEAGDHNVTFDKRSLGNELPDGIYFYQIMADGKSVTRSLIFTK